MTTLFLDLEGSDLMPLVDQIWCVCVKVDGEDEVHSFRDNQGFVNYIQKVKPSKIVFHNGLAYDLSALRKVWNIDFTVGKEDSFMGFPCQFVDTLLLSQVLNADRIDGHSLASWGERLGFPKGEHSDWSQWSPEMEEYCVRDVRLTNKLYHTLLREVEEYGEKDFFSQQFWTAAKINYYLMAQQADTGIGFDASAAQNLLQSINGMMEEIEQDVEPNLPSRPLNKGELDEWKFPAKPFKKDGSIAATMEKWMARTGATLKSETTVLLDGVEYTIKGGEPTKTEGVMKLANQSDLKDWLVASGWKCTLWNFKRDARGKPMRDDKGKIITTTPKMQEGGKLCPNLEAMEGDLVRQVVKWLSLRNRRSVIEGWLSNPRLQYDGRLSAGAAGFASTFRQRHTTVVNVPKAQDDVTLGKEMRSLFIADKEGYVLVGYDAVALENRVEAHYCLKYPGGKEHAETILDGDPHTKNAFVFYTDKLLDLGIVEAYDGLKEEPRFKPFRSKSKNARYALAYGCSPKKLATTLGEPEHMGEELYQAFWEANPALTALRERLTMFWETVGGKQWIKGIDGRKVRTRSKHSVVNTLFQSCGALAMDYSALFMDRWLGGIKLDDEGKPCYHYKDHLVYRVGYFHDELIWMVPEQLAEEIGELGVKSIEKAGEFLKLQVPLTGEWKQGRSWKDIH